MEGQGNNKALPEEKAPKKGMTKMIALVVVIILIIAAIGVVLLMGGKTTTNNVAPTASLIASPAVASENTAVQFNASASQGQNGATIQYYLWNFGDGSPILNTTVPTATHTYSSGPGMYEAVVTVADNNGLSTTSWLAPASVQVLAPVNPTNTTNVIGIVNDTTPIWFNASAAIALMNAQITTPQNYTNTTINYYLWNFGDGSSILNTTSSIAPHVFSMPGSYQISVTLNYTSNYNGTLSWGPATTWPSPGMVQVVAGTATANVADATPPIAIVTIAPKQVVTNNTAITFVGNGSGGYGLGNAASVFTPTSSLISSILWHFGDGTADLSGNLSTAGSATHTYVGNGIVYLAWMTATSNCSVTVDNVTTTLPVTSTYYVTVLVVPPSTSIGGVVNPNTFTEATIGEPQTLDPAWDYETSGGEVLQNTYQTLVFYNGSSTSSLIPVLATQVPTVANGGISLDGKNYTFTIRQGVKFQDGNVMTTTDVVYSFDRQLLMNSPEGPNWMYTQFLIPSTAKWKVGVDYSQNQTMLNIINNAITSTNTTVTFHLISPCPAWLDIMAFQGSSITEKAWIIAHTGLSQQYTQDGGNGYIDRNVMGTGPYELKTWAPNQYILLQRWDGYWGQKPALQFVVIQKVQNVGSREEMLLTGQADSVYIPRQNMADVTGQPDVTIVQGQSTADIDFIGMTENISAGLDVGNIPATFFSDINVRQAFVHAFAYENYLSVVLHGSAIQPNGPIPLGFLGYDPNCANQTYDLNLTAQYLKQAIDPRTNVSYADEGFSIVLYYNSGNDDRELQCQFMKTALESLHTLGLINGSISVQISTLDWPTYLNDWENKELPIFSLGWLMDYPDPDDFATPFCNGVTGVYAYFASVDNATITNWTEVAASSLNNTLRVQLYADITQGMHDNAYYIWTDQPTTFHVQRSWVQGYVYNQAYAGLIFDTYSK